MVISDHSLAIAVLAVVAGSHLSACGAPSRPTQERANPPGASRVSLDAVWAPAGGSCPETEMEQHASHMRSCGFVSEQSEWQGPSALLDSGGEVTLQLAGTGRFLRATTRLWPGYYTVPFRSRPFGTCPGQVLQYLSPRSRRWVPFMWQVDGRMRAVVSDDCGTVMQRVAGDLHSAFPPALSAPPDPYFETGRFDPYPDDFGFDAR